MASTSLASSEPEPGPIPEPPKSRNGRRSVHSCCIHPGRMIETVIDPRCTDPSAAALTARAESPTGSRSDTKRNG